MKKWTLVALSLWSLAAQATIDRRASVEAAYRLFPLVLQIISDGPEVKRLPANEKRIFERVLAASLAPGNSLGFSSHPQDFELKPEEARRWMRMALEGPAAIEVNLEILNRPEISAPLPLIFKTLFHEFAHRIGEDDWSQRDRAAQFIEAQTAAWTRTFPLEAGGQITVFSAPRAAVEKEYVATSVNRPQPTQALLIETAGKITDATEPLLQSLEKASPFIRSLLNEANRFAKMALDQMLKMGADQLNAQIRAAGIPNFDFAEFFGEMSAPLKELRLFELQDVDVRGDLVRLKATWETAHKERPVSAVKFDGLEFIDSLPVPVTILWRPAAPGDFTVAVRPNADVMTPAKVRSVIRGADGRVAQLKIGFPTEDKPRSAHLSVAYKEGFRWIPAQSIEKDFALFEVPWDAMPPGQPLVAESLLVGTEKSLDLDRLVELNEEPPIAPPRTPNGLVEGRAGIWGWNALNQKMFITEDKLENALSLMVAKAMGDHPHVEADGFLVEAELKNPARVSEIRLHYKRTAVVSTNVRTPEQLRRGEKVPDFKDVDWNGERVHLILGGNAVTTKDVFEIVSIPGPRSEQTEIRAEMKVPFVAARALQNATEGHIPPLFTPILLEVILHDGQILTHEFGRVLPTDCEIFLRK